ncbi:response regulator [Nitrosopumilus adriaticus]|jgi:CheY-like chemotaxis protein|uniref:Putative chemotaxis response regulator receiver protein CheY n=1 Tax=Nitrosopumilus adriaticus TaxID=1580092 RepID=A0A0D5C195_9ARCH|nr:response regulator [Nitrosopumilus adriaticus]AJW70491.1 putative chemotaxis response regulator receiver protein CheY [Nitrosopumilus adriaticus]
MVKRILVAEDNRFTAMQYEKILQSGNHEVEIAKDGDDCIKKYIDSMNDVSKESKYDVLILDHSMPQRNGAEVASDILSLNPKQKIILASAYALSTERNFSKLKDKILFLQKPFQLSKILELV